MDVDQLVGEDVKSNNCLSGIRISRNISIDVLESLKVGMLVKDEKGKHAILLDIEIKEYKNEKHIYMRLSSCSRTILIIK